MECSWCGKQIEISSRRFHVQQYFSNELVSTIVLCPMCYGYTEAEPADDQIKATIARIANDHGVSLAILLSPARSILAVRCRDECALTLREMGCSLKRIGMALKRDHSSIIHSLTKARAA